MPPTLLYSLAGAGVGFLVAIVIVRMFAGTPPPSDTAAITLFVGTFLAGCGAIAGAITGGVAEFLRKPKQARAGSAQRAL
jgi:hypothetical protein